MTVTINAQGAERKRLVKALSHWLGEEAHYCGAPTFAYEVGRFTVDKNGSLSYSDLIDDEVIERLLEYLYDEGFDIDMRNTEETPESSDEAEEAHDITIHIPTSEFTDAALANLETLVNAKGNLIKKALGTDELHIEKSDEYIAFPWFGPSINPMEMKAYTHFITALCEMAKTQKRITAKEKAVDNEKYAFRCFLLRLGFIGDEYKQERKILLRNLEGSSAFKTKKEVEA